MSSVMSSAAQGPATPEGPGYQCDHDDQQCDSGVTVLPALLGCHGHALFDHRGRYKGMERCGRRHGPFQACCAFPWLGGGRFAVTVERKSVVEGKGVDGRVAAGVRHDIKKK